MVFRDGSDQALENVDWTFSDFKFGIILKSLARKGAKSFKSFEQIERVWDGMFKNRLHVVHISRILYMVRNFPPTFTEKMNREGPEHTTLAAFCALVPLCPWFTLLHCPRSDLLSLSLISATQQRASFP